ncbi:hypothetical protein N0824_02977 [Microcystis sp. 0824]|nr:hypothetical protein N0824_02977 [Microcystis sp. 0824]
MPYLGATISKARSGWNWGITYRIDVTYSSGMAMGYASLTHPTN